MKKKVIPYLLAGALVMPFLAGQGLIVAKADSVRAVISVDGDVSDWANVAEHASGDNATAYTWKMAVDDTYLYYSVKGTVENQYDFWKFQGDTSGLRFIYPSGSLGKQDSIKIAFSNDQVILKDAWYGDVSDVISAYTVNASMTGPGDYMLEAAIPLAYFPEIPVAICSGTDSKNAILFTDIQKVEAEQNEPNQTVNGNDDNLAEENNPVGIYEGIVLDGNFSDWDSVMKYDIGCSNEAHPGCLTKAAAVFDGDQVFLYIKEAENASAAWAGSHGNGKFAIRTDLGNTLLFQLTKDGNISGIDGASCKYYASQWEIAIPKAALPEYLTSLNFGYDHGADFVSNFSDIRDTSEKAEVSYKMEVDGNYEDWKSYPHSEIEYSTAGNQTFSEDGSAALYSADGRVYGHVKTVYAPHLSQAGQELTTGVTLKFSNGASTLGAIAWKLFTVDTNGNINQNPQIANLANGTYEFYIMERGQWANVKKLSELEDMSLPDYVRGNMQNYGKVILTISDDCHEMEFYMDLEEVAKTLNCEADDFKTISGQFINIGDEWITTAGTSTGPILGLVLSLLVVIGTYYYRRRKHV